MKKDTGIIRRVDDLGRVVIPGILRKQLKIEEGDCFVYSIDTETNAIEIKKYNPEPIKEEEKDVEQKAIKWLADNKDDKAVFTIHKSTIVCIYDGGRKVGYAICSPKDAFSPSIGMIISYCRAIDMQIPYFIQ